MSGIILTSLFWAAYLFIFVFLIGRAIDTPYVLHGWKERLKASGYAFAVLFMLVFAFAYGFAQIGGMYAT